MMVRTGDVAQSNLLNSQLGSIQQRLRDDQLAIATGKAARSYADIADQSGMLVRVKEQLELSSVHITQNNRAVDKMNVMQSSVGDIAEIGERLRTMLVQRLNGGLGESVPLHQEIDSMMEQTVAALNVKLDGTYLFAGSRTDTVPVQLDGAVNNSADLAGFYHGDDVVMTVRADTDIQIAYGANASEFEGFLAAMADAKEAHLNGDQEALQTALDDLTDQLSFVADKQAEIGTGAARLESTISSQQAEADFLGQMVSDIEDADLATAMANIARYQVTIEASYLAISRINSLSLADYIR